MNTRALLLKEESSPHEEVGTFTRNGIPVGRLPDGWSERPLLKAVSVAVGQVDPRRKPFSSMVLVAPDHIEPNTGRLLQRITAAEQHAISGKYLFKAGDVVYSKIRPYLRKAILADFEGLCSADMYPLTPASDVSSAFMFTTLLGHRFSTYAESVSVRSGIPSEWPRACSSTVALE